MKHYLETVLCFNSRDNTILSFWGSRLGLVICCTISMWDKADLSLWDDDLHWIGVICAGNWVWKYANCSNHHAGLVDLSWKIAWVSNNKVSLCSLSFTFNTQECAIWIVHYFGIWLAKHISAAIDCTQPSKCLQPTLLWSCDLWCLRGNIKEWSGIQGFQTQDITDRSIQMIL